MPTTPQPSFDTLATTATKQKAFDKTQIRKTIRKRRRALSAEQQQIFAQQIAKHVLTQIQQHQKQQTSKTAPLKVAVFLSIDGEIGTSYTIQALWAQEVEVYLPRIHPFNPQQLIFLRYQQHTKLIKSSLGMNEPKLNCQQLCPVDQLDIIFTPLVAFDNKGHRLGMGGGFYDRTLAPICNQIPSSTQKPRIIGLAHNCQQIEIVPTESWDLPLTQIITPNGPVLK